jgi:hypothetical protein
MSKRSEELRRRARELTAIKSEDEPGELMLDLAQACIALARNEEWLDGEISPVEAPERSAQSGQQGR